ncbi:hypothetical protein IWZ03DRAFT_192999 [Phyllosticta citriasiana]|uniref:Secreted protein n=1 Tax=Phyllosticta citriasiana TaxID=595635 RepID=A0ABR1KQD2_9PEZI
MSRKSKTPCVCCASALVQVCRLSVPCWVVSSNDEALLARRPLHQASCQCRFSLNLLRAPGRKKKSCLAVARVTDKRHNRTQPAWLPRSGEGVQRSSSKGRMIERRTGKRPWALCVAGAMDQGRGTMTMRKRQQHSSFVGEARGDISDAR